MKKTIENIKNKPIILVIIILILLTLIVLDFIFFKHIDKNEENYNQYKIEASAVDNFVFLGDSITDFYPLDELYDDLPVINSGVSGYTTDDILDNIDSMVYVYNPTKVFLLIGTNDIQQGKDEAYIVSNIKKIVKNILKKRPKTKIYIESIYPINNTDNEKIDHSVVGIRTNKVIKKINKNLKKYCENNNYTYINMYDELADSDGNISLKYTKEGLHLTDMGYLKVTKTLYKYLND